MKLSYKDFICESLVKSSIWDEGLEFAENTMIEWGSDYTKPLTGKELNENVCDVFSEYIQQRVQGMELFKIDLPSKCCNFHIIMKYKNRFIDAEVPNGVKDWFDIPYMKTVLNKNKSDWELSIYKEWQPIKQKGGI